MTALLCLTEQETLPALQRLPEEVTLDARPLADLLADGWQRPLLLLGSALALPDAGRLLRRTYHNPAPLLLLPPFSPGDIAPLLAAPAPVTLVRQSADTLTLTPDLARFMSPDTLTLTSDLARFVSPDTLTLTSDLARFVSPAPATLQVFCTEALETALHTGALALASGKPVIWAYRPTRAATPVVWVLAQLLRVSARTAPLEREALWRGLLAWAETHIRAPEAERAAVPPVDPALLRAIVVAYAARPNLTRDALAAWLATQLGIQTDAPALTAALAALQNEGALDAENRPQRERFSALVNTWGLHAWVRETRRVDQG